MAGEISVAEPTPAGDADETVPGGPAPETEPVRPDAEPVRWTASDPEWHLPDDGEDGDEAPRTSRPVARVPTEQPKPRGSNGWRVAAVIGLLIAWMLVSAILLLWGKVDELNSDVAHAKARLSGERYATIDQLAPLEKTLSDLGTSVARLDAVANTSGASAATELASVKTRVDQVVACVNAYMDVIRRWSTATNRGTITYAPC